MLSVEQYLGTAYHPDVDYIDGRVEERNVGQKSHGKLQARMYLLFVRLQLAAFLETRIRISETRYRLPDVCVYQEEPDEDVFTRPPLLCVEILSPDDRMSRVQEVVADYLAMGVPAVWVLDPLKKLAYVADAKTGLHQVTGTQIAAGEDRVVLSLDAIFSDDPLKVL